MAADDELLKSMSLEEAREFSEDQISSESPYMEILTDNGRLLFDKQRREPPSDDFAEVHNEKSSDTHKKDLLYEEINKYRAAMLTSEIRSP